MTTYCRRLFIANNGSTGLTPVDATEGGVVALLLGSDVPIVLRDRGDGTYEVIGECYLHGVMNGEAIEDRDVWNRGLREILLTQQRGSCRTVRYRIWDEIGLRGRRALHHPFCDTSRLSPKQSVTRTPHHATCHIFGMPKAMPTGLGNLLTHREVIGLAGNFSVLHLNAQHKSSNHFPPSAHTL